MVAIEPINNTQSYALIYGNVLLKVIFPDFRMQNRKVIRVMIDVKTG